MLAAWTVSTIFADSFYRAANRYLIYLLPPLVLYLADLALQKWPPGPVRMLRSLALTGVMAAGLAAGVFSSA